MNRSARIAIVFLLSCAFSYPASAQTQKNILFVKPGDASATHEMAAEFINEMSAYIGSRVSFLKKSDLTAWIANSHEKGLHLLKEKKPAVAFISTGFFLKHLQNRSFPVAQIGRFGSTTDRYYLVTTVDGPESIDDVRAKEVRGPLTIDWPYLEKVVFPPQFQPGKDFILTPTNNMADSMFELIEESAQIRQFDALLLDEDLKYFFSRDELIWPFLKIIWRSEILPPGLVVMIGDYSKIQQQELSKTLKFMKNDKTGVRLLQLMNSSGFNEIDGGLLKTTILKYEVQSP